MTTGDRHIPWDVFRTALAGAWRILGSMLVPAHYQPAVSRQQPAELDFIRTPITYREVFGTRPTRSQFFERLSTIGLHSLVAALSHLNSVLQVKGVLAAQDEAVGGTFDSELVDRIRNGVPDWRGRLIYSPQQVLLTIKSAILHSPNREDTRQDAAEFSRAIAEVLLMATDILDEDGPTGMTERGGASITQASLDDVADFLLPHAIRSSWANFGEPFRPAIGRASIMFGTLAVRPDLRASPDYIDISGRLEVAIGLSVLDYLAMGAGLVIWFHHGVLNGTEAHRSINPQTFWSQTILPRERAASFLQALTNTYESAQLAIRQREDERLLFSYDILPFMRRPLYQLRGDVVVPVSLALLEARVSSGIYHVLFDSLDDSERGRLSRFYGQLLEAYVRDAILRALPNRGELTQRVFRDFAYRTRQGERLTSDVVAVYPGAGIFFEVTATRLRLDSTLFADAPESLARDLERIVVDKARQLHDRISDFRRGLYCFGDTTPDQMPTIMPVIVTGESLPMWTATMIAVRRRLLAERLLQGEGIEPLRIIGVDEVEMLEAVADSGAASVLEVLREHACDPELRNVSLRNFLVQRHRIGMSNALISAFAEVRRDVARVLFGVDEI